MEILHNTIGFIGCSLIIVAYLLLQTARLSSDQLLYSVLNLVGATFIIFSLCFDFNSAAFFVEAFWVVISVVGIARVTNRRKRSLEY